MVKIVNFLIGILSMFVAVGMVLLNNYLIKTMPFLTDTLMNLAFGLGVVSGVFAFTSALIFATELKTEYIKEDV